MVQAMTPEGVTKDQIKHLLASYGDELYAFWPVQTGYGVRTVDCLVCFRGQFIAVEAKRKGMRARRFQELILARVRKAHGYTVCVDSADGLKEWLDSVVWHEVKLVAKLQRPPPLDIVDDRNPVDKLRGT
jgi:hypothetical protein